MEEGDGGDGEGNLERGRRDGHVDDDVLTSLRDAAAGRNRISRAEQQISDDGRTGRHLVESRNINDERDLSVCVKRTRARRRSLALMSMF